MKVAFVLGSNGPEGLGLRRLAYAESDAENFARAIKAEHVGFSVTTSQTSSRESVLQQFDELISDLRPSDDLLFYFAGHGVVRRGDFFLVLNGTRPNRFPATALSWNVLKEHIRHSAARTRIVILDCCHAGEAMSDELGGGYRGGFDAAAIGDTFRVPNTSLLMACSRDGLARETAHLGGGAMTTLILQGLGPERKVVADESGRISLERLRDWMWDQIERREEFSVVKGDKPLLQSSGGPRVYLTQVVREPGEDPSADGIFRESDAQSGASRHPEFLSLPEALYLLCAHPETGELHDVVNYGIATAAIAELALASRLVMRSVGKEIRVNILDRSPIADLLLNSVLQNLQTGSDLVTQWLSSIIDFRVLWKHLIERSIIQERTVKSLIFFSRTVHPLCDGIRQNKLRYELAAALGQSEKRFERHLILGGICSVCDHFDAKFTWAPSSLWITAGERARASDLASLAMTLAWGSLAERETSNSSAGAS